MHELNKTEIEVLRAVYEGRINTRGISKTIGRSSTRVSVIVEGLRKKGFLQKERNGVGYLISFSPNKFVDHFKRVLAENRPSIECLTDSKMTLLGMFLGRAQWLQKRDITSRTMLSQSTIRDFLATEVRCGVLRREGRCYRLSKSMGILKDFLEEYSNFISWTLLKELAQDTIVQWRLGFEFIFSVPKSIEPGIGQATGITAFGRNGVDFITSRDYFHFLPSKMKMGHEEFILDNILMGTEDTRNILNSAIYLKRNFEKVDMERFLRVSETYGIRKKCEELVAFITAKKTNVQGFPSYKEFIEKYQIYRG